MSELVNLLPVVVPSNAPPPTIAPAPANVPVVPDVLPAEAPGETEPPDMAVTQLREQLLRAIADAEPGYFIAVFTDDGQSRVEDFKTTEAVAGRIRELDGTDTSAFPFVGFRLQISRSPFRYLLTPWGRIPLFDPLPTVMPENDGYLGERIIMTTPPRSAEPLTPADGPVELMPPGDGEDEVSIFSDT